MTTLNHNQPATSTELQTLRVSELNDLIRGALDAAFPGALWIAGEVRNLRPSKAGHLFFELVEKEEEGVEPKAKVDCALFSSTFRKLRQELSDAAASFNLQNDIEIRVRAKVDYYPKAGRLQLIVQDVDPTFTLGRIARQRMKILADLKKRGLLDKNKQTAFRDLPLKVGLLTSVESAAYWDFLSELEQSGYAFEVRVANCFMQGKLTQESVSAALDFFRHEDVDVICVVRGGGSAVDLSWFDSARIAEAIAVSPVPVITGIGHQVDRTISDEAAFFAAKTPTAVAQFLVGQVSEFLQALDRNQGAIVQRSQRFLDRHAERLLIRRQQLRTQARHRLAAAFRQVEDFRRRCLPLSLRLLAQRAGDLNSRADRIRLLSAHLLKTKARELQQMGERIHPAAIIEELGRREQDLTRRFDASLRGVSRRLTHLEQVQKARWHRLKLHDREAVLRKGYCLVSKGSQLVKDAHLLQASDEVTIHFRDGDASGRIGTVRLKEGGG